jgi:hypothetical protein
MHLDGLLAYAKLVGGLLVQHASHNVDENVTFARSQSFSTLPDF